MDFPDNYQVSGDNEEIFECQAEILRQAARIAALEAALQTIIEVDREMGRKAIHPAMELLKEPNDE